MSGKVKAKGRHAAVAESGSFWKVVPFEPEPGQVGPGPDELRATGEVGELVPGGAAFALARLMFAPRKRREPMGLSLTDVSERSGLSRQAIHKLETGRNDNPTLGTLDRYALALDTGVTLRIEDVEPQARS